MRPFLHAAFATGVLAGGCAPPPEVAGPESAPRLADPAPPEAATGAALPGTGNAALGPWTGEIRVTLGGCTSCADCRASIRQISKTQSGADQVDFNHGVARIVYATPAMLRVCEVARALSGGGLLKVHVDRVEVLVSGHAESREGGRWFVANASGQAWPLRQGGVDLADGQPVLLLASVAGWKEGASPACLLPRRVTENP